MKDWHSFAYVLADISVSHAALSGLSTRVDHAAELDKSKGKFKSRADVPKIPRRTSLPDASENNENNMGIDSRPFGEFAKPGRRRTQ